MSSIGKVFIVLNAVLALVFLGAVSSLVSKGEDFKKKYEDEQAAHKAAVAAKEKEVSDQKAANQTFQKEIAQANSEAGRFKIAADSANNALEQEKTVNAQLRSAVDEIKANLDNFRATNQQLAGQLEAAHKDKDNMRDQRDAAVAAADKATMGQRDAESAMRKAQDELANMQDGAVKAMKERDILMAKLQAISKATGYPLDNIQTLPEINGFVAEVNGDMGLVALNVGKDQGVETGFGFDIYKGDKYKGKIVIDKVEGKFSYGRINITAPGARIEKGDMATTKLK